MSSCAETAATASCNSRTIAAVESVSRLGPIQDDPGHRPVERERQARGRPCAVSMPRQARKPAPRRTPRLPRTSAGHAAARPITPWCVAQPRSSRGGPQGTRAAELRHRQDDDRDAGQQDARAEQKREPELRPLEEPRPQVRQRRVEEDERRDLSRGQPLERPDRARRTRPACRARRGRGPPRARRGARGGRRRGKAGEDEKRQASDEKQRIGGVDRVGAAGRRRPITA